MAVVINQKGTKEYLIGEGGLVQTFPDEDAAEKFCKEADIDLKSVDFKDEKEMVTFDIPTEKSPEPKKLEPTDQNIIDTFLKVQERNPKLGDSAKAMIVADKCNTTKSYVYAVLNEWSAKEH